MKKRFKITTVNGLSTSVQSLREARAICVHLSPGTVISDQFGELYPVRDSTKSKLDWAPVISSLLHKLQCSNFAIIRTDDGGDVQRYDPDGGALAVRRRASRHLAEVDEGWLTVLDLQHSPRTEARKLQLYIVLGNGPEEIVCDHACDDRLEKVIVAHHDLWEGSAVPRCDY